MLVLIFLLSLGHESLDRLTKMSKVTQVVSI